MGTKNNYVITIAREFGSLGRLIAKKLAEELGIEYYDRDLVEFAAQAMNVHVDEIAHYDDYMHTSRFKKMLYPFGGNTSPILQDQLFEMQKSLILEMAQNKRPCVIVGRCSDDILKDCDNLLKVFIYAPYEARKANCLNEFSMTEAEAEKMINRVDRSRSMYYKYYTGKEFNDATSRDLMINTSILGVDGAVSVIKAAVQSKFMNDENV